MRFRSCLFTLPSILFSLYLTPRAWSAVLWQIGVPDGSYRDLAIAGNYPQFPGAFPNDVDYRVGGSTASKDWPFIHPGPGDHWAGSRVHPFRIRFDLKTAPTDACRLLVHLVDTQAGAPFLEARINQQTVYRFDTEPGKSDAALTDPRAGQHSTVSVPFPAKLLRPGENSIVLSVVGDRSWILYDAIVLESGPEIPAEPRIGAIAVTVNEKAGSADVRFRNTGCEGDVGWSIGGGARTRMHLLPGPNRITVPVPTDSVQQKITFQTRDGEASASLAPRHTVWKIGATDRSYYEFAIAGHWSDYYTDFPRDVNYHVGASKPERDWPYVHPGPSDSFWAGGKRHPFRIVFSLGAKPAGVHELIVNTVDRQPRANAPVLEVNINGRQAMRFALPSGASDDSLKNPAAGRPYKLTVPFPADYLSAGSNVITLTVVEGSWLLYDSVSLDEGSSVADSPVLSTLRAATTPDFKEEGGFQRQVVRVSVFNGGAAGKATVRISGGGAAGQGILLAPGPNAFDILIPPLERPTPLKVTVSAGGADEIIWIEGLPGRQ